MKIRTDFVSNSSSSSFIIGNSGYNEIDGINVVLKKNDAVNTIKLIRSTFDASDDIPYESDLDVRLYVKNKDFREIEFILTGDSSYEDTYVDWKTGNKVKKDPEEIGWDSVHLELSQFISNISRLNEEQVSKIEGIVFDCDDYETSKCNMLAMLYRFFERHSCNPDADRSERNFLSNEKSSFIQKLAQN